MKKQLIAAAVATSISAIAFADVSITGNANYEYFSKDAAGIKTNDADTEVNLSIKGKSGDTSVVANLELTSSTDNASTNTGDDTGLDVEDLYMTTKIGDFNIKAGDFASSTTALGGEIDNGGRAINKLDINTTVGGIKVGYAVSSGKDTASATSDYTVYNTDGAAVYASTDVQGITLAVKEQTDSYTLMGAKGSVANVDFRIENWDSDTATSDVLFYEVGTKLGALNVSYAAIDADAAGLVTEDDSSIFAREMASSGTGLSNVDGVNQVTVSTVMDGTTLTAKLGELTGTAGYQDAAFSQLGAKRKLASGATINVTYDDYEATGKLASATMTDTQVLEVDLSIAF
jgi:hypothetical protein